MPLLNLSQPSMLTMPLAVTTATSTAQQPAPTMSEDKWLNFFQGLLGAGAGVYSSIQAQDMAREMAKMQQQGQNVYLNAMQQQQLMRFEEAQRANRIWTYVGVGAAVVGGGALLMHLLNRRRRR